MLWLSEHTHKTNNHENLVIPHSHVNAKFKLLISKNWSNRIVYIMIGKSFVEIWMVKKMDHVFHENVFWIHEHSLPLFPLLPGSSKETNTENRQFNWLLLVLQGQLNHAIHSEITIGL